LPLFLNTKRLNRWIPKLIESSKKELILIVPYIQISKNIFRALKRADRNGVQIILIYRENKLNDVQKETFLSLNNISLLHHPHIHSKCYYNGELLIIGSMNLYEYSEKNNREMGALFSISELDELFPEEDLDDSEIEIVPDDDFFFMDSKKEMSDILVSATFEHTSPYYLENKFELKILLSEYEECLHFCNSLSQSFLNKKFVPLSIEDTFYTPACFNYYDRIDVIWDDNRWAISIKEDSNTLKIIYDKWMSVYEEFEFEGFKYYWNYHTSDILVYADRGNNFWTKGGSQKNIEQKWKKGIDYIIAKYRTVTKR